jgi:hypothetical protein
MSLPTQPSTTINQKRYHERVVRAERFREEVLLAGNGDGGKIRRERERRPNEKPAFLDD